jgi:hypothetical protein
LGFKQRSITQRLKRAKSTEAKTEVALAWAAEWQREQFALIRLIEQGISRDDYDLLCRTTGQLKEMSRKRLPALCRVIDLL